MDERRVCKILPMFRQETKSNRLSYEKFAKRARSEQIEKINNLAAADSGLVVSFVYYIADDEKARNG